MKRLYYLDHIKVMLTVLVIFHHAALPYSPFSSWPYSPSDRAEMMPWIWHFHSVNASYFMGLYFFISGYFVPRSFDNQGWRSFVQKKLTRLGLPILIISSILSFATGQLEVGHIWFLESLLTFCLIYALFRQLFPPISKQQNLQRITFPGMLAIGLLMGIGGYFIRLVSPQDNWIWLLGIIHIEPAHYLQYIMMFVLGIISYRYQWFDRIKNSTGLCALVIGIALMIGNLLRDNGPWNDFVTEWFGIYESLFCVFFCFGLLWFIGKYANYTNHFLNWCAQQSYGAYAIHLFVLLGIQYATDQVQAVGIIKFLFIGTLTTILSFYLTSLIRKIPGVKRVI